jgi:hypothetical protein
MNCPMCNQIMEYVRTEDRHDVYFCAACGVEQAVEMSPPEEYFAPDVLDSVEDAASDFYRALALPGGAPVPDEDWI